MFFPITYAPIAQAGTLKAYILIAEYVRLRFAKPETDKTVFIIKTGMDKRENIGIHIIMIDVSFRTPASS